MVCYGIFWSGQLRVIEGPNAHDKIVPFDTFLSTEKSGKSRIKNPFLDSPKGTHPEFHPQMKHLEVCQNSPLRRKENLLKIIGTHGFGL